MDTGKFFGTINGPIMNMMVADNIYKKIKIFDYQGVCFKGEDEDDSNSSSFLYTVSVQLIIIILKVHFFQDFYVFGLLIFY